MCTVTFIARRNGYALGMNRDEQRARPAALPPALRRLAGRTALFPSEPAGGTWIGANDLGVTLALLNWYSVPAHPVPAPASRGGVIPALLTSGTPGECEGALRNLPLEGVKPFRLAGIFPSGRAVVEWRWNQSELQSVRLPWEPRGWYSSGFDEPGAQQARQEHFEHFLTAPSAGTLAWLRRLHSSHSPSPGPYSHCMHRADAVTVSYTEIVVGPRAVTMRYHDRSPCLLFRNGTVRGDAIFSGGHQAGAVRPVR